MFESSIGKTCKVVFKDKNSDGDFKAVTGVLSEVSDNFILIIARSKVYIRMDSIVSLKEVEE